MADQELGLSVREVLSVETLADAEVVAGHGGLSRMVARMNIMEVPDVLPWVKAGEMLLTTGYPLRDNPEALTDLIVSLDRRSLAAVAIKLGRYIDELPPAMLRAADERDFPVIRLPDGVGFDDILNQVLTGILSRQNAALARAEEIHHALVGIVLAGGGLTEVAEETATLLDATVLVEDAEDQVLVTAGRLPRGDSATGRDTTGGRAGGHTSTSGALARYNDTDPGSLVGVPIVAGGVSLGRLNAFRSGGGLDSEAVSVLERAATVAALAITRGQAVTAVESRYQADLVRDLVEGRALEPARVVAQSRGFGWNLDRPLVVLVVEYDDAESRDLLMNPSSAERLADVWRRVIHRGDRRCAVVSFSGHAVALVGAEVDRDAVTALAGPAHAQLARAGRTMSVGISRPAGDLAALPVAYQQARRAVAVGHQAGGPGSTSHFDDLGVYRLLSLIPDSDELTRYVAEILGPLVEDDPEAVDLRDTLLVLLETNLNVAAAARRLHFHYNTLRYRIGKLERLVGPFTQDPNLRLNLLLALQVLKMRSIDR